MHIDGSTKILSLRVRWICSSSFNGFSSLSSTANMFFSNYDFSKLYVELVILCYILTVQDATA